MDNRNVENKLTRVCITSDPSPTSPILEHHDWTCEVDKDKTITVYLRERATGSVTAHFQDGIVREIEQHTRKRMKKKDQ